MSAPTPGPWTIPLPSMGFSSIRGPNGELIFGLAAGSVEEKQPDDVCEANARLIAAAPDLYASLTEMLRMVKQGFTGWPASLGEIECHNRMIAALAKALGTMP